MSGNPDAIVIIDFPETFAKVGPALVRTGNYDPSTTWDTDGLASRDLPKDVGTDAIDGLPRHRAGDRRTRTSTAQAFDKAYTSSDPKDVERQTFDAQNFDAVMLCYLAAVAAGSTDGPTWRDQVQRQSASPPGDQYTFEELSDAITALENGDDIDYQGASGAIDMDENGDATAGVYDIYEYKDGSSSVIGTSRATRPRSASR